MENSRPNKESVSINPRLNPRLLDKPRINQAHRENRLQRSVVGTGVLGLSVVEGRMIDRWIASCTVSIG